MPFDKQNGFVPRSFDDIMTVYMTAVNTVFKTSYDINSFRGTNFFKYYYAGAQVILQTEATFAEAYARLCDYIRTMNERINIPKTPRDGLIAAYQGLGYSVSLEPQTAANAGTVGLCVDMMADDPEFEKKKAEILQGLKTYTDAGIFSAGEQRGDVRLSNGQIFDFGFNLPIRHEVYLQLRVAISKNTSILPDKIETIKEKLLANIKASYQVGLNFEPNKYFTISRDAPYAAGVLLEWKKAEVETWSDDVYAASYRELFALDPARISVILS